MLYQRYNQSNCVYSFYRRLTISNLRIDIAFFQLSIHSNMSLTFTLTSKSSIFVACYFPAIDLSDGDYKLGLMDFETYHMISNVNSSNNKFYFDKERIVIPEGSYEIRDINKCLRQFYNFILMLRERKRKEDEVFIDYSC